IRLGSAACAIGAHQRAMTVGIVEATKRADIRAPILIRLTGTNEAEARDILAAEGFSAFTSMDDVVRAAVERAAA
ncbi:MAG: hypothetical protein OXH08_06135, partial [Gammaproteobacteria bacterium]|nr:hypothetical protein [Gammaproteobacteria bacterium]